MVVREPRAPAVIGEPCDVPRACAFERLAPEVDEVTRLGWSCESTLRVGSNRRDNAGGAAAARAGGDNNSDTGGDGGDGSFTPNPDGTQGRKAVNTGGGGGGGTGMIWIRATMPSLNGTTTPPATLI